MSKFGQLRPYRKVTVSGRPLTGPCQEAIAFRRNPSCRRVHVQIQLPATRLPADSKPHPFSRSAGCEPNRASHPSGSSMSRCAATALAALAAPEKRWCQAVSKGLVTFLWLSRWRRQSATGSRLGRFSHLHSYRVAQRRCPIIRGGCTPDRFPGSPPLAKPLHETALHIEGLLFAQYVVARPREFVRDRLERHDAVTLALLALVEALGLRAIAQREVGRLHEGPGQVLVAVLGVAFTLLLAIALAPAIHTATVGAEVTHAGKARDRPRLQHDRGGQRLTDAGYRLQQPIFRA